MATKSDPETSAARAQLYLGRAQTGRVFNHTFAFYSGKPTIPTSFTGNLVLGARSGGVGAGLINGAAPPIEDVVTCDEPAILDLVVTLPTENVTVVVTYDNPDVASDIYVIFNTSTGQSFGPVDATLTGVDEVTILFPAPASLPAGLYSLRIMRADDPGGCFDVRNGIFNIP